MIRELCQSVLLCLPLAMGCGRNNTPPSVAPSVQGGPKVGVTQFRFEDTVRKRPLATRIWYPADPKTVVRERSFDGVFISHSAQNAELAATPPQFPLVLMSHGTGGSSASMVWIAEYLAAHGYLVAAVEHFGNTFRNDTPEGFIAVWRRPVDVSRVLDALLSEPRFGKRIAADRIGAAGFSAGGCTVIALAGGIYHPELMGVYSREHPSEKGSKFASKIDFSRIPDMTSASLSYRDERIRAVFAMAPALGPGFETADLSQIRIPVGIVASAQDDWLPLAANAQHFAESIPGAELTQLPAGGHFIFMPLCNAHGFQYAHEVCTDIDPSIDRKAIHEQVQKLALDFFERHLQ
jgi:predicted dienelactone hydrolase